MAVLDVVSFLHPGETLLPGPFGLVSRVEAVGASSARLREAIARSLGGLPCEPDDPDGFLECFSDLSWLDNYSVIILDCRSLRMIDAEARELLEHLVAIAARRVARPVVRIILGPARHYLLAGLQSSSS